MSEDGCRGRRRLRPGGARVASRRCDYRDPRREPAMLWSRARWMAAARGTGRVHMHASRVCRQVGSARIGYRQRVRRASARLHPGRDNSVIATRVPRAETCYLYSSVSRSTMCLGGAPTREWRTLRSKFQQSGATYLISSQHTRYDEDTGEAKMIYRAVPLDCRFTVTG